MVNEFLLTVQVSGAFAGSPFRFVNYPTPVVSGDSEYAPLPFTLTMPARGNRIRIRADGVPRQIVDALRAMENAPVVDIAVISTDEPDTIEISHRFTLVEVRPAPNGMSGVLKIERALLDVDAEMGDADVFAAMKTRVRALKSRRR